MGFVSWCDTDTARGVSAELHPDGAEHFAACFLICGRRCNRLVVVCNSMEKTSVGS